MNINNVVGYSGTVILSITLFPQVFKTYSEKDTTNISSIFLFLQFISNIIFIYYGILIQSMPVIVSNSIVITCTTSLLIAKLLYINKTKYQFIV